MYPDNISAVMLCVTVREIFDGTPQIVYYFMPFFSSDFHGPGFGLDARGCFGFSADPIALISPSALTIEG